MLEFLSAVILQDAFGGWKSSTLENCFCVICCIVMSPSGCAKHGEPWCRGKFTLQSKCKKGQGGKNFFSLLQLSLTLKVIHKPIQTMTMRAATSLWVVAIAKHRLLEKFQSMRPQMMKERKGLKVKNNSWPLLQHLILFLPPSFWKNVRRATDEKKVSGVLIDPFKLSLHLLLAIVEALGQWCWHLVCFYTMLSLTQS